MKKIGFIDYFLDEWHANHLPQWIQDAGKGDYQVAYAWGEMDKEGRRTNAQWAAEMGIQLLDSIEEVVERSDVRMRLLLVGWWSWPRNIIPLCSAHQRCVFPHS